MSYNMLIGLDTCKTLMCSADTSLNSSTTKKQKETDMEPYAHGRKYSCFAHLADAPWYRCWSMRRMPVGRDALHMSYLCASVELKHHHCISYAQLLIVLHLICWFSRYLLTEGLNVFGRKICEMACMLGNEIANVTTDRGVMILLPRELMAYCTKHAIAKQIQ